ncbi:MAG: helix-turn-helix domain-containing protein [Candidatus Dormibacteria bacterium]|jgi:excisionase family DNA binding protein
MADRSALLTVPEVAKLLKLSVVSVRREITAGQLPAVHLGRSVRIARTDHGSSAPPARPLG